MKFSRSDGFLFFFSEFNSDECCVHVSFKCDLYYVVKNALTFIFVSVEVIDHGDGIDVIFIVRGCWRFCPSFVTHIGGITIVRVTINFRLFEEITGVGGVVILIGGVVSPFVIAVVEASLTNKLGTTLLTCYLDDT